MHFLSESAFCEFGSRRNALETARTVVIARQAAALGNNFWSVIKRKKTLLFIAREREKVLVGYLSQAHTFLGWTWILHTFI